MFVKANKNSLEKVSNLLEELGFNAGLHIKRNKNKISFRKCCANRDELKDIIGFSVGHLPTKYVVGVSIGTVGLVILKICKIDILGPNRTIFGSEPN